MTVTSAEEWSAHPQPVFTTCKKTKQIALTFDDGPYAYTASLSDSLSRNAAHGSFYVNGNVSKRAPGYTLVAQIDLPRSHRGRTTAAFTRQNRSQDCKPPIEPAMRSLRVSPSPLAYLKQCLSSEAETPESCEPDTWSHVDITTLTEAQFHKQLVYIETALKRILGASIYPAQPQMRRLTSLPPSSPDRRDSRPLPSPIRSLQRHES